MDGLSREEKLKGMTRSFFEGDKPPPPLAAEQVKIVAEALQRIIFVQMTDLADRFFDRVEDNLQAMVDIAAKRVVPKNIATFADTLVSNRTAQIEDQLLELEQRLGELAKTKAKPWPTAAAAKRRRRELERYSGKRKTRKRR